MAFVQLEKVANHSLIFRDPTPLAVSYDRNIAKANEAYRSVFSKSSFLRLPSPVGLRTGIVMNWRYFRLISACVFGRDAQDLSFLE